MTLLRTAAALLALALVACGAKDGAATKRLDELSARLDEIDKRSKDVDTRLKKIEDIIRQATQGPPEPDPSLVYSVPIAGDPYRGSEHAQVTVVEAFEFA